MQQERNSRPRRGGGRQNRRRPSGRERQAESAGSCGEDGHNRGGGSRGRSAGHGRRDSRGRGAAEPSSAPHDIEPAAADLELQEEEKEEQGSYSKRKVVSNWHRYEDTEKEAQSDSGESQRGTDFSVLLSSAGDSFTQFRFAEEKEWITENLCPKQLPGFYADCESLVQAFEKLPLHLKLNVAADLVQDATPVILPSIKSKSNDISKRSGAQLQQPVVQSRVVPSSISSTDAAAHLILPNRDGCEIISSEALQKNPLVSQQETDQLDEDLDLLLKLDAPVNYETSSILETVSLTETSEEDLKMPHGETDLNRTEEKSSISQQQQVLSKCITEEELEDWLDSMIS
ncbi:cell death regulator Aven [Eublepharis macularius]|uniref:Cell death regulator Aven n=1 Tax=Eublepharis macularius TaxID=481883 RepID=A0AA97IYA6_EUBMA|nr:cell death regulator Aven [Eublepharis macularius]